jgi:uncharacterized protein (DUF2147 family)
MDQSVRIPPTPRGTKACLQGRNGENRSVDKSFKTINMKVKNAITVWLLSSAMAIPVVAQDAAKYELKSAVIQKEITTMGQKFNATWYIDDSGRKESVDMTIKNGMAQGVDKHVRTLMIGDTVVTVDMDLKVAHKMALPEKPINYLQITPDIEEKYKLKENGEEDVAGKKCKKYSLEIMQMGQTLHLKTWVWKGLVLKSETAGNGMTFAIETATEVQENVPVSSGVFSLPDGVIFQ